MRKDISRWMVRHGCCTGGSSQGKGSLPRGALSPSGGSGSGTGSEFLVRIRSFSRFSHFLTEFELKMQRRVNPGAYGSYTPIHLVEPCELTVILKEKTTSTKITLFRVTNTLYERRFCFNHSLLVFPSTNLIHSVTVPIVGKVQHIATRGGHADAVRKTSSFADSRISATTVTPSRLERWENSLLIQVFRLL